MEAQAEVAARPPQPTPDRDSGATDSPITSPLFHPHRLPSPESPHGSDSSHAHDECAHCDCGHDSDEDVDVDIFAGNSSAAAGGASPPALPAVAQPAPEVAVVPLDASQQDELRRRILAIQQDEALSAAEKARRVQQLMTRRWDELQRRAADGSRSTRPQNRLRDRRADFSKLSDADRAPSYYAGVGADVDAAADAADPPLGCKHYRRGCKLQAHCCGRWFPCRFCHDEVSDHNIIRNLTTTMMCMKCQHVQPAAQDCESCGFRVAHYYCKDCKLWDDDKTKNIYHCYDCGICRIGKGLGQDYFHCKKCNVCMAISLRGQHRCIERNLESDCPICGEYMFTSTTTVIFMPCGHCIHYKCHQEYIQTNYQCPTCFKSLANMADYFGRIDAMLAEHEMPPEYRSWVSFILCNDCEKKSEARYHFLYHKCAHCGSYNTKTIKNGERKPGHVGPVFAEMAKWMEENGVTEVPCAPPPVASGIAAAAGSAPADAVLASSVSSNSDVSMQ